MTQSMFACIDQHVDQSRSADVSLFALWCLNQHVRRLHRCLLRIRPLASEKRLQMMKTCAARQ